MIICYMFIKLKGPEFKKRYECVIISNANRFLKEFANMKGLQLAISIVIGLSIHYLIMYISDYTMASKLRQKTKLIKKTLHVVG